MEYLNSVVSLLQNILSQNKFNDISQSRNIYIINNEFFEVNKNNDNNDENNNTERSFIRRGNKSIAADNIYHMEKSLRRIPSLNEYEYNNYLHTNTSSVIAIKDIITI
ncbi:hypothetical protein LY90DRAFT_138833 [Neocallimastix californiae]|uniref:Uncharacterized protein n=1 Tax=Neocallimastix californiae TaxID=1754190 RepID=A0A1Y2EVX6_9FUNG|nr:hypothetical protein LY90DRAFT_138833 [Neocallimastix californiae]|eukprot:ORY75286.1 hypothetical protein LY90DRAFT_138833 [Neocallimastix californiae]